MLFLHRFYCSGNKKDNQKSKYFIINTDISTGQGVHWVSLIIHKKRLYGFDSYGRDLNKLLMLRKLKIKNSDRDVDQRRLQTDCGQRSMSWLIVVDRYDIDTALLI